MENNTIPIKILYEDNHLLILNKKAGQIVQGDKTGDKPMSELIKDYLRIAYNKPGNIFAGVVHRIDRPVTGVVVFAKTSKALTRMNEMFQLKQIKKTYWAVVCNKPKQDKGLLKEYLFKNEKLNKSFVTDEKDSRASLSELEYKLHGASDKYFLLDVNPLTGRHHQIRVMLAHMGCPIKGDVKYGAPRTNTDGSIHLHAHTITFMHPVKKEEIKITAPPPDDAVWNYFSKYK